MLKDLNPHPHMTLTERLLLEIRDHLDQLYDGHRRSQDEVGALRRRLDRLDQARG